MTAPEAADPRLGMVLADSYRIVRQIGRGGMGAVYEAHHVRLPKRFAVKFLDREFAGHGHAFARFQREAEIASSLGSSHIAQVLDFNVLPDGVPYIVMEYLEGEDLGMRLKRGTLSADEALAISAQVSAALAAAHKTGVVHRDLKPENIFMCRAERGALQVKLLDFGISKMKGTQKSVTGDVAVMGTPAYMSPEQARGDTRFVDHRTDVYSFGAVLFEALSGRPVYQGDTVFAILTKLATESPPRLPGFPAPVDAVLQRALSREPADRWPSLLEMHDALVKAFAGESPVPLEPSRPRARRSPVIAILALMLLACAGVVFFLSRSSAPGGPRSGSGLGSRPAASPETAPPDAASSGRLPGPDTLRASSGAAPAPAADAAPSRPPKQTHRKKRPPKRPSLVGGAEL